MGQLVALLTRRSVAWISGVTTVALLVALLVRVPEAIASAAGYDGHCSMLALDMNLWPPNIEDVMVAYGDNGRRAMKIFHLTYDALFPAAFALLLLNVLDRFGHGAGHTIQAMFVSLPFIGGLADYSENVAFILLASFHSSEALPAIWLWLTGFLTLTKFLADGGAIVLVVIFAAKRLRSLPSTAAPPSQPDDRS